MRSEFSNIRPAALFVYVCVKISGGLGIFCGIAIGSSKFNQDKMDSSLLATQRPMRFGM